ncbi:hypothetical protein FZEAL_10494, partial [Fusarium zealandicum]
SPPNPIKAARPPPPPSAAIILGPASKDRIRWQVDTARHLAHRHIAGPYEIGDYLCDILRGSGQFVKVARRVMGPTGQYYWQHMMLGQRVQPGDGSSLNGRAVALSTGALFALRGRNGHMIHPEWQFSEPTVEQKRRMTREETPRDVNPIHPGLKPGSKDHMWF